MAIISESVPLGVRVLGFDTVTKLDADKCKALAAAGLSFWVRYIDLVDGTTPLTLDAAERDAIVPILPGMTVQFARLTGWTIATGQNDGAAAARNHLALFSPDVSCSCDLEGKFSSVQQCIDYASTWYELAVRGGLEANALQLYVGAGVPLTEDELYHALPFRGYWRSGSKVPEVAVRGYRMRQVRPLDQTVCGVRVDLDVIETDYLSSRPRWARLAA